MNLEAILNQASSLRTFIKIRRNEIGAKAIHLSRALNKGDAYISQVENGRIKNLKDEAVVDILTNLELSDEQAKFVVDYYKHSAASRRTNEDLAEKYSKLNPFVLEMHEKLFPEDYNEVTNEDIELRMNLINVLELLNEALKKLILNDVNLAEDTIVEISKITADATSKLAERYQKKVQQTGMLANELKKIFKDAGVEFNGEEEN
ncbi:helix-turn-helix domain-containing protein [Bacillus subtilis]|uniref:helix-turn-helix domain-containing protein n=1 Tax=Bacillus TaxID=1386 RepID=UPI00148FA9DA|nr:MULTISPECIES: helix-turn-helix domain-containing protein [Bacillus]MBE0185480.1 hypothetical protein [Bacillus subtilis]NOV05448.1 hypothetical protein [Bacillus sp. seq1]